MPAPRRARRWRSASSRPGGSPYRRRGAGGRIPAPIPIPRVNADARRERPREESREKIPARRNSPPIPSVSCRHLAARVLRPASAPPGLARSARQPRRHRHDEDPHPPPRHRRRRHDRRVRPPAAADHLKHRRRRRDDRRRHGHLPVGEDRRARLSSSCNAVVDGEVVVPASIGHVMVPAGTTEGVHCDRRLPPRRRRGTTSPCSTNDTDGDGMYGFGDGTTDVDGPALNAEGQPVCEGVHRDVRGDGPFEHGRGPGSPPRGRLASTLSEGARVPDRCLRNSVRPKLLSPSTGTWRSPHGRRPHEG